MEYLLILLLQLIGIGFHVMQKVSTLGNLFPDKPRNAIFGIFMQEDWDTLMISALILALNEIAHYILHVYAITISSYQYFDLISFGVALVLGYAGQNLVYKWLGSARDFLDKKVTDKLN
jgi:hypothetical protein